MVQENRLNYTFKKVYNKYFGFTLMGAQTLLY